MIGIGMGKGNNWQIERKCGWCHTNIFVSLRLSVSSATFFRYYRRFRCLLQIQIPHMVLHFQPFDSNNDLEKLRAHKALLFLLWGWWIQVCVTESAEIMRPHHSISSPAMAIVHKHTEITDLSSSEVPFLFLCFLIFMFFAFQLWGGLSCFQFVNASSCRWTSGGQGRRRSCLGEKLGSPVHNRVLVMIKWVRLSWQFHSVLSLLLSFGSNWDLIWNGVLPEFDEYPIGFSAFLYHHQELLIF